jgi:hypothetical protein
MLEIVSDFVPLGDRKTRLLHFEETEVKTIFTDTEAFGLCGGITNGKARQIWVRNQINKLTPADTIAAHIFSMNVVKEFGLDTTSFLMALPPKPIEVGTTHIAFGLFDRLRTKKKHPCLRLVDKSGIKYSIAFYYEEVVEMVEKVYESRTENSYSRYVTKEPVTTRTYDYDTLVIESDKTKMARIYRDGKVCPINNATTNKPVIELLMRFFKNPQEEFLYYSTTMGQCSNCDKRIYLNRSIEATVGPICAKNLGYRW